MNRGRAAGRQLRALDQAVGGTYRNFLQDESPWPAAFFSDTLVVASPVHDQNDDAALGGLALQAAWLQLDLARRGFFMRGALCLGKFHMRAGLIFGPALVEAYELESGAAVHPRVILGRNAEGSQQRNADKYSPPEESPANHIFLRDDDGWAFIDYLGLLFDEPVDLRPVLSEHRDLVISRLSAHRSNRRLWEKYRWVAEYHNQVVGTRFPEERSLLVPAHDVTRQFVEFAEPRQT